MNRRGVGVRAGALLFLSGCLAGLPAADTSVVDHPYLGVTHVFRTGSAPNFPRDVKIHLVKIDLTAPSLSFALAAPGGSRDVLRLTTLSYLNQVGGQIGINSHFFLPYPSADLNGDVIGFSASGGTVFSPFELPTQNYAILRDAPAINIDPNNNASIVTRAPGFSDGTCFLCVTNDGLHVNEPVVLWNAFAGSAQIVTNGVSTIPCYLDATHPNCKLVQGTSVYNNADSWYSRTAARVAVGLSQDRKTLFIFTVDAVNGSSGMKVTEVADLLVNDYGVHDALNMDGGGSTSLAMENPSTHVRALVNSSADGVGGRVVATSLAVFASSNTSVTHTVNTSPPDRGFSIDGAGHSTAQSPAWNYGTSHTIATTSPQTVGGTRYIFNNWSDAGALSHTVAGAATAKNYTATFDVSHQLTTAVSPVGAGTVTPASGSYYAAGTVASLEATPSPGFAFSGWTGPVANAALASTTTAMSEPRAVTANFVALRTSLSGAIIAKSGANSARVNTIRLTNSGPGRANAVRISSMTLTQTVGSQCSAVVTTGFPVVVANIAPASSATGKVTVNYSGCTSASRFTVSFAYSASAGAVTGSTTLYNQTR